jgi:NADPH-dependent curcumin reductase CurA
MAPTKNRQVLLAELPKGRLAPVNFQSVEGPVSTPPDGEVLVRVRLISLDAANRAWMQGPTYRDAVTAGQVMAGYAVAASTAGRRAWQQVISCSPTPGGKSTRYFPPKNSQRCQRSSRSHT